MSHNPARDPKSITLSEELTAEELTTDALSTEALIEASDLITDREVFLQEQNQCCLCGHELNFDHMVDFMQLTVIETASCAPCKIQLRKRLFTLN